MFVDDELGLPAVALQRHHGKAGGICGHGGAVVSSDDVQAQVTRPKRRLPSSAHLKFRWRESAGTW
jgi:hypothetical protein